MHERDQDAPGLFQLEVIAMTVIKLDSYRRRPLVVTDQEAAPFREARAMRVKFEVEEIEAKPLRLTRRED